MNSRVAEHDVTVEDGESIVKVNEIIVHEKWFETDSYTYNYDVCLLKTNDLGINGETVDFACLPNQGEHVGPTEGMNLQSPKPRVGLQADRCYVAGWGSLELGGF